MENKKKDLKQKFKEDSCSIRVALILKKIHFQFFN